MDISLPDLFGFHKLPPKQGISRIAYISKPGISGTYTAGESSKITGFCSYQFLSGAGIVRGGVFSSPQAHTSTTPTMIKIGSCAGPFSLNTNLQQVGVLMYESPDSSLLIIPVTVKSSLLVEVDT